MSRRLKARAARAADEARRREDAMRYHVARDTRETVARESAVVFTEPMQAEINQAIRDHILTRVVGELAVQMMKQMTVRTDRVMDRLNVEKIIYVSVPSFTHAFPVSRSDEEWLMRAPRK